MPARSTRESNSAQQVALRALQHRAQLTRSEQRRWLAINRGQLGVCFRRQVPIGGRFIADFVGPAARLVVEGDGAYHGRRRRADGARDRELTRLNAGPVLRDLEAAVTLICAALGRRDPHGRGACLPRAARSARSP